MKTIAMLGDGAWGTAIATVLAYNGYTVKLWCYNAHVAEKIATSHVNSYYLPDVHLDSRIIPVTQIEDAVCGAQWVFEAVPVKHLRAVLTSARDCFSLDQTWVLLSKGIERDTLLLPTEIVDELYGAQSRKAVCAGPSYAYEVATQQITAVTVAGQAEIVIELQTLLANDFFRPYATHDIIGVQVGAAVKNVIALGVGMLDGIDCNDNTKAFFITRGLAEMAKLAVILGGKQETIYGLSGVGDLILTSMGRLSKNAEVGRRLAQGELLADILERSGYVPEGINTVAALQQLTQKYQCFLPISSQIFGVVFEGKCVSDMMRDLARQSVEWEPLL